jgi:hypothetical protein
MSMLFVACKNEKIKTKDIFDDTYVHRLDIKVDQAELDTLMAHPDSLLLIAADVKMGFQRRSKSIKNVGFRIKGNTSRFNDKKSFKLSFNAFEKGRKYKGLEKLSINAYANDPTHLRPHLMANIYKAMGVKTVRSSFTELYVNDKYYGLYNIVEHIDEEFLKQNYHSKKGNLYKCASPADLTFQGQSKDDYRRNWDQAFIYELKTNKKEEDYSGLIDFIDLLNNTPIDELQCSLEDRFKVEDYLKTLAVDVVLGNWDSYFYTANNFYLYDDPKSGKMRYIPYDFDNTFGMDWTNVDWAKKDIYDFPDKKMITPPLDSIKGVPEEEMVLIAQYINFWMGDTLRPLNTRLLEVDDFRNQYNYHLKKTVDYINSPEFGAEIDRLFTMLSPYLEKDTSDNFTWEEVQLSMNKGLNSYEEVFFQKRYYLPYGLREFIKLSSKNVLSQLEEIKPLIIIDDVSFKKKGVGIKIKVKAEATMAFQINAKIQQRDGSTVSFLLKDNGNGVYTTLIDTSVIETASFFLVAEMNNGEIVRKPCVGYY